MFEEIIVVSPENSRCRSGDQARVAEVSCRQSSRFLLPALLAILFVLPSIGCRFSELAGNEAVLVSYRDMVWAKRAYNLRYGNCDRPYGEHFYNGFCAGYADVCNGGDGYVPALPPQSYRSSRFQSADGVQCVNAWFEGYPAGVAAARKEKVGNYNNVLVSKMMNDAIEMEKELKNGSRAVRNVQTESKEAKVSNPPSQSSKPVEDISIGVPPLPGNDSFSSVLIPAENRFTNHSTSSQSNITKNDGMAPRQSSVPPIVTGSGTVRSAGNGNVEFGTSDISSRRWR